MFRAKRKDNGEWVEGSYIKDYVHHFKNGNATITNGAVYYEVDPDTLEQIGGKDFEAVKEGLKEYKTMLFDEIKNSEALNKKIEALKAENEKMKELLKEEMQKGYTKREHSTSNRQRMIGAGMTRACKSILEQLKQKN